MTAELIAKGTAAVSATEPLFELEPPHQTPDSPKDLIATNFRGSPSVGFEYTVGWAVVTDGGEPNAAIRVVFDCPANGELQFHYRLFRPIDDNPHAYLLDMQALDATQKPQDRPETPPEAPTTGPVEAAKRWYVDEADPGNPLAEQELERRLERALEADEDV